MWGGVNGVLNNGGDVVEVMRDYSIIEHTYNVRYNGDSIVNGNENEDKVGRHEESTFLLYSASCTHRMLIYEEQRVEHTNTQVLSYTKTHTNIRNNVPLYKSCLILLLLVPSMVVSQLCASSLSCSSNVSSCTLRAIEDC